MAVSFQQTDTLVNAATTTAHCASGSVNPSSGSNSATVDGIAGTTQQNATLAADVVDANCVWMEINDIDDYDGASGTWTWRLDVTNGNMQCELDHVFICHVDSGYSAKNTLCSVESLATSITNANVYSGTLTQNNSVTIAAGDKIILLFGFNNLQGMENTFGYTPSQLIDAPGNFPAPEVTTYYIHGGLVNGGLVNTSLINDSLVRV
jgi:hypothetical protein